MNEKKTAEDLKLYGISYTWKHSDGREERIPPMEIMVKKINEAQETAALREENERLKLEKTELYWRSQFSFLQRDYDELEKKHGKENERLKEALKKLWIAADIILDPLDSEELSQPVYKGLWKEIRNAKKLLKADSQEQNRQPPQPESEQ